MAKTAEELGVILSDKQAEAQTVRDDLEFAESGFDDRELYEQWKTLTRIKGISQEIQRSKASHAERMQRGQF